MWKGGLVVLMGMGQKWEKCEVMMTSSY
jgi:hypothetical protein